MNSKDLSSILSAIGSMNDVSDKRRFFIIEGKTDKFFYEKIVSSIFGKKWFSVRVDDIIQSCAKISKRLSREFEEIRLNRDKVTFLSDNFFSINDRDLLEYGTDDREEKKNLVITPVRDAETTILLYCRDLLREYSCQEEERFAENLLKLSQLGLVANSQNKDEVYDLLKSENHKYKARFFGTIGNSTDNASLWNYVLKLKGLNEMRDLLDNFYFEIDRNYEINDVIIDNIFKNGKFVFTTSAFNSAAFYLRTSPSDEEVIIDINTVSPKGVSYLDNGFLTVCRLIRGHDLEKILELNRNWLTCFVRDHQNVLQERIRQSDFGKDIKDRWGNLNSNGTI